MPTRRAVLLTAAATVTTLAGAGVGAIQLAEAGLIPGKSLVDRKLGYCDAPVPPVSGTPGPVIAGTFPSALRGREVGYRIAYPPGYAPGASHLPVCLVLHG